MVWAASSSGSLPGLLNSFAVQAIAPLLIKETEGKFMQIILTHDGVRVQANSQQENEDQQRPDMILVSTQYGQFEIRREHAETLAALVGQAHRATKAGERELAAGPDNVLPMFARKQAD